MEEAESERLLGCEMPHTDPTRPPERASIRPSGKNCVDGRGRNGRCAVGILWYGQALPLHPRVEHPADEVKDPGRAPCALRAALGHREVRQEKGGDLRCGKLDRKRRRYRLWCRGAPDAMASWEE